MILFQKGFNFRQDGPGNRLVYHLCGCNMTCPWCANPEGMKLSEAKRFPEKYFALSPDEIVKEALRCKAMFFSGGGITFSGGEPTCQFAELKEVLKKLKAHGINTAIETNAMHPYLSELFPFLDCLMMDVKHTDGQRLKEITAGDLSQIVRNLNAAVGYFDKVWIRIPLIHGFNDDNLAGFRELFSRFPRNKLEIEILPYHEFGKKKWQDLGYSYRVEQGFPSDITIKEFQKL